VAFALNEDKGEEDEHEGKKKPHLRVPFPSSLSLHNKVGSTDCKVSQKLVRLIARHELVLCGVGITRIGS
jgi:hypothetical protein